MLSTSLRHDNAVRKENTEEEGCTIDTKSEKKRTADSNDRTAHRCRAERVVAARERSSEEA